MIKSTLPALLRVVQDASREKSATNSAPRRRTRGDWQRLAAELADPDLELTPEVFAGIWTTYQAELRAGRELDPVLTSLLTLLSRQAMLTDDATDDFEDELDQAGDDAQSDDHPLPGAWHPSAVLMGGGA